MSAATGVVLLGLWIQAVDQVPTVALTDLHWFPPYVVAAEYHRMAGDRAWHLSLNVMYGDTDHEEYWDAKERAEVWHVLKEAAEAPSAGCGWDTYRLRQLAHLRERIGLVAYYRGEMPDPVKRGTR